MTCFNFFLSITVPAAFMNHSGWQKNEGEKDFSGLDDLVEFEENQ
jgi:hypothetical protein